MSNKRTTLEDGWHVDAEQVLREHWDISLESPCGKFGGSLGCAEETGTVLNHDSHGLKDVPQSVIDAAQRIEDGLNA